MMVQWHECKAQAKDALLLFRLGDFYEAFYDDADQIAKELHLTYTQRQGIPMCGVPAHTFETYLDKLVAKGYKVAVAEQMEDPKQTKGIVKRAVDRIITPGTTTSPNLLKDKSNNFFVSLDQIGMSFGIAIIDLTTSEFRLLQLDEKKEVLDELHKLRPSELLISEAFRQNHEEFIKELSYGFHFVLNVKEDVYFDHKLAWEMLNHQFTKKQLEALGISGMVSAINASAALLTYLKEDLNLNLDHLDELQTDSLSAYMSLDYTTMHNLELTESIREEGKKNTILHLLDSTMTSMGGRLLSHWVQHPLLNIEKIHDRQNGIEEFIENQSFHQDLTGLLNQIRDLERILMRISSNQAGPRDLLNLRYSLHNVPSVKSILSPFKSTLIQNALQNITDISSVTDQIAKTLVDAPPLRISDCNVIRGGFSSDLDELRSISSDSKTWIANYQVRLREETQIRTLKVGFTRVFGYYIDVSKGQSNNVPDHFHRRQTLVNSERFITEELKNFEHKILTAEERIKALEQKIFEELRTEITKYAPQIREIARAIAQIDALYSLSKAAMRNKYVKPEVDESDMLHIKGGRHPIIERNLNHGEFIPNDAYLNKERQLFLITGPNMAGKSTYIRQVALIAILAQIGSYVPADSAHIGLIDKVFSRIGASDDLARGQSTFMVEMMETANILNNATSRSLVILDEIGRGTSTYDGISIAWAVAEYLLTTQEKKAKTLFATHYWELTKMQEQIPGVLNYQVAVQETDSGIAFLRKIVEGGTDKSYGIHVARLAGLPYSAIKRAEAILTQLEQEHRKKPKKSSFKEDSQLSLFQTPPIPPETKEAIDEINSANFNQVTPIEVLQKLFDLQKRFKN